MSERGVVNVKYPRKVLFTGKEIQDELAALRKANAELDQCCREKSQLVESLQAEVEDLKRQLEGTRGPLVHIKRVIV